MVPKDVVGGPMKKVKPTEKLSAMEEKMRLMDEMVMTFLQR